MIGDILSAVSREAQAFLRSLPDYPGAQVVIETDFKNSGLITYSMPLLIIDMVDAPEMSLWLGGATRADWVWGFNSYNLMPDAMVEEEMTVFSGSLLDVIDAIRQHFSTRNWTLPARTDNSLPMNIPDIEVAYAFRFTLIGLARANHLEMEGLEMGWRITFDSVAIDDSTDSVICSTAPLETVQQIDYPPAP